MTGGLRIQIEPDSRTRIVRGFSALFWGIPFALLTSVRCAMANWLLVHDAVLPVAAFTLLAFGTWQLSRIPDTGERSFRRVLEPAKLIAAVCAGLSPFVYFWNHHPEEPLFGHALTALPLFGLFFIFFLNLVLRKLTAVIGDEILAEEMGFFTRINLTALSLLILGALTLKFSPRLFPESPFLLIENNIFFPFTQAIGLMFFLIPLSLTMTLLWKVKDVFSGSEYSETRSTEG